MMLSSDVIGGIFPAWLPNDRILAWRFSFLRVHGEMGSRFRWGRIQYCQLLCAGWSLLLPADDDGDDDGGSNVMMMHVIVWPM